MRTFIVVAILLAAAGTAAAQVPPRPPQIDELPPLPKAPTETFDVIVEGEGSASRQVDGDGNSGICSISSHTASAERYEYGRGRGLRVVFTKLGTGRGSVVLMKRAGRRLPGVDFNVRARLDASAQGEAKRFGPVPCEPTTEQVGDERGCGKGLRRSATWALGYARGNLSLDVKEDQLPPLPGSGVSCGTNGVETFSQQPVFGWFGPPELKPAALPKRLIFGSRRAFVSRLSSGEIQRQFDSPNPAFAARALETAEHRAVVRFIRVRPGM